MPRPASVAAPTWPPSLDAYNYVLTLNAEEIAWEGLRRNPGTNVIFGGAAPVTASRAAFHPASASGGSQKRLPPTIAGASIPFVHPALTAPDAPICWLAADAQPAWLDAVARRPLPGTPADFVLTDHPCIRHVVIGPGDIEQLLIRTSERSLTIRVTGHRASRAPVCLKFVVSAQSRVKETAAVVASYPDLLTMRPRWVKKTSEQMLTRDAFIAFDGRSAGASHREVAEVIYGLKRVRDEWSGRGCSMKERMRRALAKGQALCNGGHWRLLEQACRFRS